MRCHSAVSMIALILLIPLFSGCLMGSSGPVGDVPSNSNVVHLINANRPSISVDGQYVTYLDSTDSDDFSEIWVMNLETREKTMVLEESKRTDLISDTYPTFSPNGDKIIFNKWGGIDVLTKNGDTWDEGCTRKNISIHGTSGTSCYSPDETKIVYQAASDYGNIWLMDADGSNITPLATERCREEQPVFAPDGENVVYVREDQLWTVNIETKEQHQLIKGGGYSMPSFTSDGRIVVLWGRDSPHYSDSIGGGSVWIMNADGTNKTMLYSAATSGQHAASVSVSADGSRIVMNLWWQVFLLEDPDGDGIWEDSDGDGMADVCDDYPNNPDRGYLKDDSGLTSECLGLSIILISYLVVMAVGVITVVVRKRHKRKKKRSGK